MLFERLPVHPREMALDPLGILNDVVEAISRVVPRRQ